MPFSYDLYTNFAKFLSLPEDNGSITLASDLGITAGTDTLILVESLLGNGPHGTTTGDFDFYAVTLAAGQQVNARVDAAGISGMDTALTLFDAAGNGIAFNDNFDGADPFLKYTAVSAGPYFLRVATAASVQTSPFDSASGTGTGLPAAPTAYRLWIDTGAPLPFPSMAGDTLNGDGGHNLIFGAGGDDTINGGNGNDVVHGGTGINAVKGEDGDDLFVWTLNPDGSGGHNLIDGGAGYDRAEFNGRMHMGSEAGDVVIMQPSLPTYEVILQLYRGDLQAVFDQWSSGINGVEEVILRLHGGDDIAFISQNQAIWLQQVIVDLGSGNDELNASGSNVRIVGFGGAGNDVMTGGVLGDVLEGNDGDDTIDGAEGSDTIDGGAGIDTYIARGAWKDFTITRSGSLYTFARKDSSETDKVVNVEKFDFNGMSVDLTGAGEGPDSDLSLDAIVTGAGPLIHTIGHGVTKEPVDPSTLTVAEKSPTDRIVAVVRATDPNFIVGDEISFALETSGGAPFTGPLTIVKTFMDTAEVRVSGAIDFETIKSLAPVVRVTDLAGNSATQALAISVLDLADDNAAGIIAGAGAESFDFVGGAFLLEGTAANLLGDTVLNFGEDDTIRFSDGVARLSDLIFSGNQIRLASAGAGSTPLTLEGDFSNGRFFVMKTADGSAADLFFSPFLADAALKEAEAVADGAVNGGPHRAALTGDGARSFTVTLSEQAVAHHASALGVYEIDAQGNIVDARILFGDVKAAGGGSATITDVEAGHRLGFFIVEGTTGAGAASFTDAAGGSPDLSDGAGLRLSVGGSAVSGHVFHAFSAALNADGLIHARSGADPSGHGLRIAFEDLAGGGDRDFQDVVFRLDAVDAAGDFLL
jgi:Ca2+-binding RTX toxin-like protein